MNPLALSGACLVVAAVVALSLLAESSVVVEALLTLRPAASSSSSSPFGGYIYRRRPTSKTRRSAVSGGAAPRAAPSATTDLTGSSSSSSTSRHGASVVDTYLPPPGAPVLLVDVENLRGKAGFEITHPELLHRLALWACVNDLHGRVTLVIDHGLSPSAHWLPERGMGVAFAGPCGVKADDVLAREAVPFFLEYGGGGGERPPSVGGGEVTIGGPGRDVVVCTGDGELCRRCRSATTKGGGAAEDIGPRGSVRILPPARLLEELESLTMESGTSAAEESTIDNDLPGESPELVQLTADILAVEGSMRRQRSPKKRRKHANQLRFLRERLAAGRYGDHVGPGTTVFGGLTIASEADFAAMTPEEHGAALMRWNLGRDRSGGKRKESTSERETLAEALRGELKRIAVKATHEGEDAQCNEETATSPAEAHVLSINSRG